MLKICTVGAAKTLIFRVTGLNLELLTPIIISDMQSLPLIIYSSILSGLSKNNFSHGVKLSPITVYVVENYFMYEICMWVCKMRYYFSSVPPL